MRRALVWIFAALGTACSQPQVPPPVAPPPAPISPPPACHVVRLPLDGLSVCMPGKPEERHTKDIHLVEATVGSGDTKAVLRAIRVRFPENKRPFVTVSKPEWHSVESSTETEIDGFPAMAVAGLSKPGEHTTARVAGVGDSLYIAEVESPAGAAVDAALVEAFLGSLHVSPPFRIHASPEDRYTVAVPEPAVVEQDKKADSGGMNVSTFMLGGKDEMVLMVIATRTSPSDTRGTEEVLDDAVRSYVQKGGNAIVKMHDFSSAGLRGRELWSKGADGTARMRVVVAPGRVYVVAVATKRAEGVSGPIAERFFESFQIAPP